MQNKTVRVLEQKWTEKFSNINYCKECNALDDFFMYCNQLNRDLANIKKYQKDDFNSISKVSIEKYEQILNQLQNQFLSICLKSEAKNNVVGLVNKSQLKDDLLKIDGNNFRIGDKYYEQLSKIANMIFNIEEEMSVPVQKLWQQALSNIQTYNKKEKYSLLAHVENAPLSYENYPQELKEYCNNMQGMCFSLISDKKTKLYTQERQCKNGMVGIIAKPKLNSIIATSNYDMLSTEFLNDKCEFDQYFNHSKVNRVYANGQNQIYCRGTKICPPNAIFESSVDTINEIILDKNNIEVEAVFYVKGDNEIPAKLQAYHKKCEQMYNKKLPIIEIESRNNLNQYTLEDIYNY